MKYSESDIERVRRAADIRDFVPGLKGSGASQYADCPKCGKSGKNKGLIVTHRGSLDIAKCFSCDFTLNGAIDACMYYRKLDFPQAVREVAGVCGIYLQTEKERRVERRKAVRREVENTFAERQLSASGLTVDDVMARVHSDDSAKTVVEVCPFVKGGVDALWNVNRNDDEMLIFYYDLWGNPMQYARKGLAGSLRPYVRVRWSNPELHQDSGGRAIKYQTPRGAQTKLYIPQRIRDCFQRGAEIETLIVQEGEKKAEKACKHGILSVGIQGIFNIGNEAAGLVKDLQYLIQTCRIKNVVLLLDSDWDDLHRSLSNGDHADQRPNQFAKAVVKFKQYLLTMHNLGVAIDVYFGHINRNDSGDKGIDDLLVNTLKGREDDLSADIEHAMYAHDGRGTFVDIHKISSLSDYQIRDFWLLNDRDGFAERHRRDLEGLTSFRFGHVSYRLEDGKPVQASRYNVEREFWTVSRDEKGKKKVAFEYDVAIQFINANGFYRVKTQDCDVDQYKFCQIDGGIVRLTGPAEIRNFVYSYARQTTKDRDVINMLISKLGAQLGADKLERMDLIEDDFDVAKPGMQQFWFKNGCLQVSAAQMDFGDNADNVWIDRVIGHPFKRVRILDVVRTDSDMDVRRTADGERCEFLQFLLNTSNFWRGQAMTEEKNRLYVRHVVNKLTTIGFLLCDFKYQSELKAVVAMDAQMGDVGQSNGRSGKSLIGVALSKVMEQAVIDGRSTKNDDEYIYSSVTPRTRNIFIDDVRVNFDFENFFAAVTGDLQVNPKTKARFVIKNEKSPKIYITTNHAINAQSRSSKARIAYMAFSDWYNDQHCPVDDFGHQFFVDWDGDQWNLFYNLMAECCQLYFRSMAEKWHREGQGAVPPPMDDIEQRTLKQRMGEVFYQWAEVYFDASAGHLNRKIKRRDMFNAFHEAFPDSKFAVTASNFRTKLLLYCEFKGLDYNVTRPTSDGTAYSYWRAGHPGVPFVGDRDVSGGVEYFTVSDENFSAQQPF